MVYMCIIKSIFLGAIGMILILYTEFTRIWIKTRKVTYYNKNYKKTSNAIAVIVSVFFILAMTSLFYTHEDMNFNMNIKNELSLLLIIVGSIFISLRERR